VDRYDFREIEKRWKPVWRRMGLYRTGSDPDREPFYCLDFFPYPSGAGLSVGHCRNYVPTDVISRKKRMDGYNVLHPMGWDAFGQPAEEYAIKTGTHPAEVTRRNTETYRRQMELIEASYDWEREINSSDPDYYRWTQYFFLLLWDRGLAYQADNYQMWCPQCKIVLSNEEAAGGRCWRCDGEVTRKKLRQWYLKITEYADRLLDDLEGLDWPAETGRQGGHARVHHPAGHHLRGDILRGGPGAPRPGAHNHGGHAPRGGAVRQGRPGQERPGEDGGG
jgi:leucyl-tRNA synthetase